MTVVTEKPDFRKRLARWLMRPVFEIRAVWYIVLANTWIALERRHGRLRLWGFMLEDYTYGVGKRFARDYTQWFGA